ncbi:MAG: hypothetical protein EXS05_19195 [Planctomycetaceae bacterium]|nr:hypothetical protein [Planctomycetaceae bacterium]
MQIQISRSNDRLSAASNASLTADLSNLVGWWFNTSRSTGEIARLEIAQQGQELVLQVFGAGPGETIAWPKTSAAPFVESLDSPEVAGFEAHCDLGFMETRLAANIKYGVLVVQSYNRFKDNSGRANYFTREFFHEKVEFEDEPETFHSDGRGPEFMMSADISRQRGTRHSIDLGELTGLWKNTKRSTGVIRELELSQKGDGFVLRATGAGSPRDWGEVAVTPHASGVDAWDPAGFHAAYDFGFMRMLLAANINKGLLIIASYNTFLDGSPRSNSFAREFFYRVER